MVREPITFGLPVIGVILGMGILLFGEAQGGQMTLVISGGIVVLLSIGWLGFNITAL